nr:GNAT family N-acetyltransferase [Anaerolineae bacterium]
AFGSDYTESQQRTPAEWQQRLTRTPHFTLFLAVTAAGTLAGMTGISREAGVKLRHNANIISVYVAPAWRGQGVVAALLALSLAQARDWEVRRVRLAVAATNIAAIRAYVRGGFTVYGVDPEVIYTGGRYYDELLMQRPV